MIIKGDTLTSQEEHLLTFGDVTDVDDLRNIPALRLLQEKAGILSRYRLQRQIVFLERAASATEQTIDRAKR